MGGWSNLDKLNVIVVIEEEGEMTRKNIKWPKVMERAVNQLCEVTVSQRIVSTSKLGFICKVTAVANDHHVKSSLGLRRCSCGASSRKHIAHM